VLRGVLQSVRPGVTVHAAANCTCAGAAPVANPSAGRDALHAAAAPERDAPLFLLAVAKAASESLRADLLEHVQRGAELSERPQERCYAAVPASHRVITMMREPRAHVQSQWRHCSHNLDRWFSPQGLPTSMTAWLEHWVPMVRHGSRGKPRAGMRAFHCYLPANLQTRSLSCLSRDPCLPYVNPALDSTVLSDANGLFEANLDVALARVANGSDGLSFVGVAERYQTSMCTLHALERNELPAYCNCSAPAAWAKFPQAHMTHDGPRGIVMARRMPPSEREIELIDELTALDRVLYAAALARLRRDVALVEARFGTKLWCDESLPR